jgi:hypothetical protein
MSSLRGLVALAVAALATTVTLSASAQRSPLDNDWRQHNRPRRTDMLRPPATYVFQLRGGPYYPEIDEEFAGATPYETTFDADPQFYFGVELDWVPLRIPYIGGIGPGFGWGYTRTSTTAKITDCVVTDDNDCLSGQETSLTILPMHLSVVLHADELMRRTGIPLVPYAKAGLGLATWSAGSGGETAERDGVLGRDTTWGTHFALGVNLSLNPLDPRAVANMYEGSGVQHFYLFGEWMWANLDGLGSRPQMHVGTSTWVVGMAVDM